MSYSSAFPSNVPFKPVVGPLHEDLVSRCASGDHLAWSRLYDRYHPMTRAFLLRMGVPSDGLDDACQEVFLEAFRYLPRFRGDCSFKTWLYRICATQARKSRSSQRIRRTLLALLPGEVARTVGQLGHSEKKAMSVIQTALSSLTDKERLVFVLYELEGLSGRETAEIAGCPDATLWRRLHYARKKFSDSVGASGATP